MDINTILKNEAILEQLLTKYLYTVWQDNDTDEFVLKCVDLIHDFPLENQLIVKSVIKRGYHFYWERIEKLLVLR